MAIFSSSPDAATQVRLASIERKLDAIIAHLKIRMPQDDLGEVRRLAEQGQKIEAIKLHRELTGSDLRSAKEYVDTLQ